MGTCLWCKVPTNGSEFCGPDCYDQHVLAGTSLCMWNDLPEEDIKLEEIPPCEIDIKLDLFEDVPF